MKEQIKARIHAEKYDIYKEEINRNRKADNFFSGYFIYKGTIYYGHKLFVFFKSAQNETHKK